MNWFKGLGSRGSPACAGIDPSRLNECLEALLRELARLKSDVTEEELRHCKELIKGRLELRLEDTQNAALWYGGQQLLNDEIFTVEEVCQRVDSVTVREVTAMADELLTTGNLSLAVVGPIQAVPPPELPVA